MIEYTCILCPRGCKLQAEKKAEGIEVTGNACPRGVSYAIAEMTDPRRTVTTSVYVEEGEIAMLSVKTSEAVPKNLVEAVLAEAALVTAHAPIEVGDVLIHGIAGTNADLIATRRIAKA